MDRGKFQFCFCIRLVAFENVVFMDYFSSSGESDESCSIEEDITADSRCSPSKDSTCSDSTSFEKLFPTMKTIYGVQPEEPKKNNILLYKR